MLRHRFWLIFFWVFLSIHTMAICSYAQASTSDLEIKEEEQESEILANYVHIQDMNQIFRTDLYKHGAKALQQYDAHDLPRIKYHVGEVGSTHVSAYYNKDMETYRFVTKHTSSAGEERYFISTIKPSNTFSIDNHSLKKLDASKVKKEHLKPVEKYNMHILQAYRTHPSADVMSYIDELKDKSKIALNFDTKDAKYKVLEKEEERISNVVSKAHQLNDDKIPMKFKTESDLERNTLYQSLKNWWYGVSSQKDSQSGKVRSWWNWLRSPSDSTPTDDPDFSNRTPTNQTKTDKIDIDDTPDKKAINPLESSQPEKEKTSDSKSIGKKMDGRVPKKPSGSQTRIKDKNRKALDEEDDE